MNTPKDMLQISHLPSNPQVIVVRMEGHRTDTYVLTTIRLDEIILVEHNNDEYCAKLASADGKVEIYL